jgi:hypothetical protein
MALLLATAVVVNHRLAAIERRIDGLEEREQIRVGGMRLRVPVQVIGGDDAELPAASEAHSFGSASLVSDVEHKDQHPEDP